MEKEFPHNHCGHRVPELIPLLNSQPEGDMLESVALYMI